VNPVETEVGNLGFITEGVATFVINAPSSRIFPFQIQNRTLFGVIRNRRSITLQRAFISCTLFQSLLRLAASCTILAPFFRCCLPCCCYFLPSKVEPCMLWAMLLKSFMTSNKIKTHRIHRHADIVRHTCNWAAYFAALFIPSQFLPFRTERFSSALLHSVPTNPLSPLRAARPVFSKKSHKTAPCNAGSCHSFLENCYV
jgi:hypothetical protein